MAELIYVDSSSPLHAEILDLTCPIWHEGLLREAYGRWNALQLAMPWGRDRLRRVAWVEGGRLLASAKRYVFDAVLDGQTIRVLGIGAVHTPAAERGRGYARAMITRMMEAATSDGLDVAVLFSEIGARFYEPLGFRAVPRETVSLHVMPGPGAPATLVRSGEEADLPALAALHARSDVGARFFLRRTRDLIQFSVAKRRTRSALAPLGRRTTEFFVSEEGHQAVAYVLVTRGPSGTLGDEPETMWLEACGDRDPSGARVGAMLQVLAARTPAEAPPPFHAWLPGGWLPPQLRITGTAPADEILMLASLDGRVLPPLSGRDVIWWHADAF